MLDTTKFISQSQLLASDYNGIGFCGRYVPTNDGVHVGLFWKLGKQAGVIHFLSDNNISYVEASDTRLSNYYFIELNGFKIPFIYSLVPTLSNISKQVFTNLNLSMKSVFYIDGKFRTSDGQHQISISVEGYINCAVFVISILNSFHVQLLDLENWPAVSETDRLTYLNDWLAKNGIVDEAEKNKYYSYNKEIRGRHIITSPLATFLPASHTELEPLSNEFVVHAKSKITT